MSDLSYFFPHVMMSSTISFCIYYLTSIFLSALGMNILREKIWLSFIGSHYQAPQIRKTIWQKEQCL